MKFLIPSFITFFLMAGMRLDSSDVQLQDFVPNVKIEDQVKDENSRNLGDTSPDVQMSKKASNKKYQEKLVKAIAKFRKTQEQIHKQFEKDFKKKLKEVDRHNKLSLSKTFRNYAKVLDEEDAKLRESQMSNIQRAHKTKNDFVLKHLKETPPPEIEVDAEVTEKQSE